jgi:3-hydroxyanthranilate 3,4-dioxygenase
MRKKTFQLWREAAKLGAYDEMPMLPEDKQVQVHLSKNDRPQPFYLICGKDTLLALMSGAAQVEFSGTAVDRFTLKPASFVYVPAGALHRIVPTESSIMMRYKQMHAGLEGVAWYCDECDAEIYREVWDTATTLSQLKYNEVSSRFAADTSLRTCRHCGSVHPALDLAGFRWAEVAGAIGADLAAT